MKGVLVALLALGSTLAGGLFALRARRHLYLVLGFTAGVLIGVVGFDVLPEIFELVRVRALDPGPTMIALVAGFLVFHVMEKTVLIHHAQEGAYAGHHHPDVGLLSALALAGHSVLDGVGIGFGFQVSPHTGVMVAVAVIAHDFADGINTVSLMLVNRNSRGRALAALALDGVAPVAGAASTLLFHLPPSALALYLGFFAGFLLYIGAADILPEAHSKRSSPFTVILTCTGAAFAYGVARLVR